MELRIIVRSGGMIIGLGGLLIAIEYFWLSGTLTVCTVSFGTANPDSMKKLPPEKCAKIIAALKANPNASSVTRQIGGVSCNTVCKIARKAGIRLAAAIGERRFVPPKKRTRIIAALKANPNGRAVARQFGDVSSNTICKIAREAGIDLVAANEARRFVSPEKRAKIIAALKANPNASAVAGQVGGVSRSTVRGIGTQAGIDFAVARNAPGCPARYTRQDHRGVEANPNAKAVAKEVGGACYDTVKLIAKQAGIRLGRSR